MGYEMDAAAHGRLGAYFATVGDSLRNKKRRECFATYAHGLLSSLERKSIEPIAAAACADPDTCDAHHQRLVHFASNAEWSDPDVRRVAAWHAIDAMQAHAPIRTWIIDDTGFLKKGEHSVGVSRQYTGTAGKITNCQIGVSLSVATDHTHVPIDFELYLPETWTSDPVRRCAAKIPDEIVFKTKYELAIDMLTRAAEEKIPGEIVLADADYGRRREFRHAVRRLGLDYAVGVEEQMNVCLLDARERVVGERLSLGRLAKALPTTRFRRITWRDGTRRRKLSSRFAFCRVMLTEAGRFDSVETDPVWLIIEWPRGEESPTKFSLTTLPRTTPKKELVRVLKERWRTEKAYEEMKTELGLDHFEGRSFRGWHHHVSVVLCCYAFVVGERMRHFSPSSPQAEGHTVSVAA
jgi:SRSO17 transposase